MPKGSLDDIAYLIVGAFMVGIIIVVFAKIGFSFNDKWQTMNIPNSSKVAVDRIVTSGYDTIFNMFPFIFFGLFFVSLILAYQVESHPILVIFGFIMLVILVIASAILGYIYKTLVTTPNFVDVIARYPATDFIFTNFSAVVTVMGIIMLIVIYAKLPRNKVGFA